MKDKCYVLPNGECISSHDCVHGDGLPLDEFVRRINESSLHPTDIADLDALALKFEQDTQVYLGFRNSERATMLRRVIAVLTRP